MNPDVHYHGSKCSFCSNTLRYIKNRNCVFCSLVRNTVSKRREAHFYFGRPCKNCGLRRRYAANKNCVHCCKARARGRITGYQLNEEDKHFAVELYAEGFSIQEIRSKLNCTANSVREYLGLPLWERPARPVNLSL